MVRQPRIARLAATGRGVLRARWAARVAAARQVQTGQVRDPRITEVRALLSDLVRAVNLTLPYVEAHFSRELGVTIVELDMLAVLKAAPGGRLPMSLLGKNLTISTASVTRIAGQLERSGHLQRVNSTDDRRVVFAVITPSGRALLERARPVAGPALEEAIGQHYTLDEIHALRALLARLLPEADTATSKRNTGRHRTA